MVTAGTFAATWRDSRGESGDESFWWIVFAKDLAATMGAFAWWVRVALTVIAVALLQASLP